MAEVAVVGGGIGGLCAAIRLGAAGHHVSVLERSDEVGGKVAVLRRDGFTVDVGPSLLTLPSLFDDVLRVAGARLAEQVDLVRLDTQFRYHWPDGSSLDVADDADATAATFEAFAPRQGEAWRRFDERGRRIWEVSERTFLAGPMGSPWALARRWRSPRDLTAIDATRTLDAAARRAFDDPRLVQWVGRYATYSGSSPYRAPATLACIPHIESAFGVWHPLGGLSRLRDALAAAAALVGVEVRCGAEVTSIETRGAGGPVAGLVLADGERLSADVVVVNADADHLYRDLLADEASLARVRRSPPSTSGFALAAGVHGATSGLAHHNVWFSGDALREHADLAAGRVPDDPTIYACVASITDPGLAPMGAESWFVLVNAPAGWRGDEAAYADHLLGRLADRGVDLRPRLCFLERTTPADLERRFRSRGGAIYGTSADGWRAAFWRPANRGSRRGLYLVGGSSHPGGGLPLVAISARIVAGLVERDGW